MVIGVSNNNISSGGYNFNSTPTFVPTTTSPINMNALSSAGVNFASQFLPAKAQKFFNYGTQALGTLGQLGVNLGPLAGIFGGTAASGGLLGAGGLLGGTGGLSSILGGSGGLSGLLGSGGSLSGLLGGSTSLAGLGSTLAGAGSSIMGALAPAVSFLATNPAGWAILAGVGAAFIIKSFVGRDLAKAKENWTTNQGTIFNKLKSQDPSMSDDWASAISGQQSFEGLSEKDKKSLLKTAKKKLKKALKKLRKQGIQVTAQQLMQNPQLLQQAGVKPEDALFVVAQAGYNPQTYDGNNSSTATKMVDYSAEYFKATGKVVGDFSISKEFVSKASVEEKGLASAQMKLMDSDGDGKITRQEVQTFYTSKFASMTPEQLDADLKQRGFAINIDELKDVSKNITAESFANYIFDAVDQKTEFKADKTTGSITGTSDGSISLEEFSDLFIKPKQSDWQSNDGKEELGDFLSELSKSNPAAYSDILKQTGLNTSTPSLFDTINTGSKVTSNIGSFLNNYDKTATNFDRYKSLLG